MAPTPAHVHTCTLYLALDDTLVSPLHGDGTASRNANQVDCVALREAYRDKRRTYPELCQSDGRAKLVVIAGEVGGRWSQETKDFLVVSGVRRWCCLLACSAAKAFASSLMGVRGSPGAGDVVPSVQEVLADARDEV